MRMSVKLTALILLVELKVTHHAGEVGELQLYASVSRSTIFRSSDRWNLSRANRVDRGRARTSIMLMDFDLFSLRSWALFSRAGSCPILLRLRSQVGRSRSYMQENIANTFTSQRNLNLLGCRDVQNPCQSSIAFYLFFKMSSFSVVPIQFVIVQSYMTFTIFQN